MSNREFDLIIYGATSFVGKILCNYLVHEVAEPNFSLAFAARSQSKLDSLIESLGDKGRDIPIIVAESFDESAMESLSQRTEVIISTVGPYALYGEQLVKSCAANGTDYCDLTGEAHWIKRMLERYEESAKTSGARIVHSCGFDSIPSDLGVKFLQNQSRKEFGASCNTVKMRVKASKGGASGGTIASGINLYKEAAKDEALREELKDYYSLCGEKSGNEVKQHTVGVEYNEEFNSWAGPFIMAAINTRIVLRSSSLPGSDYGPDFRYDEGMLTGDGDKGRKRARRLARVSKLGAAVLAIPPLRWFALRFLLPKPGEGPTPEQQKEGFYDLRFHGSTERGDELIVKVTGDRDPGYGSTAKMLAQAAISLHRDVDRNLVGGGFWTPATVFNEKLFERLRDYAGIEFELVSTLASEPNKNKAETNEQETLSPGSNEADLSETDSSELQSSEPVSTATGAGNSPPEDVESDADEQPVQQDEPEDKST